MDDSEPSSIFIIYKDQVIGRDDLIQRMMTVLFESQARKKAVMLETMMVMITKRRRSKLFLEQSPKL